MRLSLLLFAAAVAVASVTAQYVTSEGKIYVQFLKSPASVASALVHCPRTMSASLGAVSVHWL